MLVKSETKLPYGRDAYKDQYGTMHYGDPKLYFVWRCTGCGEEYIQIGNSIMCNGVPIEECIYC